jgi:gamma-glutamyltranspeptidase/glutathione hydrolase
MQLRSSILALLVSGLLFVAPCPAEDVAGPSVHCKHGVVVSVSRPASEVGRAVLEAGGNAVDATVATAFALCVTWPEAGNIGGGGFLLVKPAAGDPLFVDYRETAPAASRADMYVNGKRDSYTMVGTPGTVRGLFLAHERFGRLPWKKLLDPAIKLARDGFEIDGALARSLNGGLRNSEGFAEFRRVLGKKSSGTSATWSAGDRLVQKDLANTLRLIADRGPDGFYTGDVARRLVESVRTGGGIITEDDLKAYEAKLRTPIHGTFRGYDIYSAPPPSSGGVALVEMLNIQENYDLRGYGRWDPRTLHLMIESMRRAYCDRARYLGDSDFVAVPGGLTAKPYARQLAAEIDPAHATPSTALARRRDIAVEEEGSQTTHLGVIDEQGTAVSNTFTLEQSFGGRIMVNGCGFLLNNEMGDFNPKPGLTDTKGLIGTPANQIAPGKRMLSSMTPTIVTSNGRVVLVAGSPGGRTIINTVFCVTLNVLEFDMPLDAAVAAPRMHHAFFPDELTAEAGLFRDHPDVVKKLRDMGYLMAPRPQRQGDAHSIAVDPTGGDRFGVADQRIGGWAAGY